MVTLGVPSGRTPTLSTDKAVRLLADPTRRAAVRSLLAAGAEAVEFGDLVAAVADDLGTDPHRLAVTLHHHHVPKLAKAGAVEWDRDHETVRYRPVGAIEDVLAALADADD